MMRKMKSHRMRSNPKITRSKLNRKASRSNRINLRLSRHSSLIPMDTKLIS